MTDKPVTFSINGEDYYNVNHLKDYDPTYFYGYLKAPRKIITKRNISNESYVYATYNERKKVWTTYEENDKISPKIGLYIRKDWVELNFIKLKPILKSTTQKSNNKSIKKSSSKDTDKKSISNDSNDSNDLNEQILNDDSVDHISNEEILSEPKILVLSDDEKFKDGDGNIIEIKTYGERKESGIYFLAPELGDAFGLPTLTKTLTQETSGYVQGEHYVRFIRRVLLKKTLIESKEGDTGTKMQKCIYVTYKGMMKICLSSRSPVAKRFASWASKTLFTAHMGTQDAKDNLAAELIGTNVQTVKNTFRTFVNKIPCVYLFFIGYASECLKNDKTTKYKKNDLLCRFGMTKDILERTSRHETVFKKEFNKDIELVCCSIIDAKYVSKAETDLKAYFNNYLVAYKDSHNYNHTELIVIDKKGLNAAKHYYESLQYNFVGVHENLAKQIAAYEQKMKDQKTMYEAQLKDKDHELQLLLKDKDHELQLKDKDYEVQMMKNEMLSMKIAFLESRDAPRNTPLIKSNTNTNKK
jgi:hypothetical protein